MTAKAACNRTISALFTQHDERCFNGFLLAALDNGKTRFGQNRKDILFGLESSKQSQRLSAKTKLCEGMCDIRDRCIEAPRIEPVLFGDEFSKDVVEVKFSVFMTLNK